MRAMDAPDFSRGAAWQRGAFVPIAQASVPMTDWGFLRSDATYDVVTVWDGERGSHRQELPLERPHHGAARRARCRRRHGAASDAAGNVVEGPGFADEAFLSRSGGGVLPVTRVDGNPVAGGAVGPLTHRLVETYWAWHRDARYSTPVKY